LVSVRRDLYISKKIDTCQERLINVNRDLYILKEICTFQKKFVHYKRDLYMSVRKRRGKRDLENLIIN